MENQDRIKHILEIARQEINRQEPFLALEHLRNIQNDIEETPNTSNWAGHQLTFAEALAAMCDPSAESEFEEALRRIQNLAVRDRDMEMRVHEHYGRCLESVGRRSLALPHYQTAKQLAVECLFLEDSARIQLRIIRIGLELDNDPRLMSFHNLKKAAVESPCTHQEQLAAWMLFCDDASTKKRGLIAARHGHAATVEYFRGVLRTVKKAD
jgi:hypothetical protein